jgi:hypothetical protein
VHVVRELPCRVIHGCEAIEERVQEVARVECCGRSPLLLIREALKNIPTSVRAIITAHCLASIVLLLNIAPVISPIGIAPSSLARVPDGKSANRRRRQSSTVFMYFPYPLKMPNINHLRRPAYWALAAPNKRAAP